MAIYKRAIVKTFHPLEKLRTNLILETVEQIQVRCTCNEIIFYQLGTPEDKTIQCSNPECRKIFKFEELIGAIHSV